MKAYINKAPRNRSSLLYIDALNLDLCPRGALKSARTRIHEQSHWFMVTGMMQKVSQFALAARNSGWVVNSFIDASIKSTEAQKKWTERREAEIKNGIRNVPQGLQTLLGSCLEANAVKVFYSKDADNDDTLAAFAERDGAAVLSGDSDFFRYNQSTFPIYSKYKITSGPLLSLLEASKPEKGPSKRNLISPPPLTLGIHGNPTMNDVLVSREYRRGAPSPLVRKLGNPHVAIKPLRQAFYSQTLNLPSDYVIKETFPEWCESESRVVWKAENVRPDNTHAALLNNPLGAVEKFYNVTLNSSCPEGIAQVDWDNHLFGIHSIAIELCSTREQPFFNQIANLVKLNPQFTDVNRFKPKTEKRSRVGAENHWTMTKNLIDRVSEFALASSNSGWRVSAFIDAAMRSQEAQDKWVKRRETEVAKEYRRVPQGWQTLLGASLEANGPSLREMGRRLSALIEIFFRYAGRTYPVYSMFEIIFEGGRPFLRLFRASVPADVPSTRYFITPVPATMGVHDNPSMNDVLVKHEYRRGAPSPLVKRLGNPHAAVKSLRQAFYAKTLNLPPDFVIKEIFPEWNGVERKVSWSTNYVKPDKTYEALLDDPLRAVKKFFNLTIDSSCPTGVSLDDWTNHLYAINAVVIELCSTRERTYFSQIKSLVKNNPQFTRGAAKSGSVRSSSQACVTCQAPFLLGMNEVEFFRARGLSLPKRCKTCRAGNKKSSVNDLFREMKIF
ncbi:hypothetical protein HDU76_008991 [Blyttiomyces sp. JEL0837]|nr:hypothetical protein HDU76_008991 [Blyttiomyces sp. JEL0837]